MADDQHAFNGCIEFDLTFAAFGTQVTRRVRVIYGYTPEWPHYIAPHQTPGGYALRTGAELYARRDELGPGEFPGSGKPRRPEWIEINELLWEGVISAPMFEAIEKLIDEDARRLNRLREEMGGCRLVDPNEIAPPGPKDHLGPVPPLTPPRTGA